MRNASGDLMDEGDMLAQANKVLLMGVPQDKFEKRMWASRALARQTGEDLPTIFGSLTTGAARASPKMLEAMGINMRALHGLVKGAIGIVGVLATGMVLLGSFTLLNVVAMFWLKKELIEASTAGTIWGVSKPCLLEKPGYQVHSVKTRRHFLQIKNASQSISGKKISITPSPPAHFFPGEP